ncbi:MAG: SpoIIE family protein phosphatase [Clostridia bacterium]|nr:SpoIIE family protein phosphatase [Clostridia bacterium]
MKIETFVPPSGRDAMSSVPPHIYDMLFAPDGGLWLLGANGIYYIDAENAEAEGTAEYSFFSVSTGLPHMATANSRSYVFPEGDAYVACTDGILGLNVSRSSNDRAQLRFSVPYIEADGLRILPGGTYRFVMSDAKAGDGETPYAVTIVKEKLLKEKAGFQIGVIAAMILAAAGVTLLLLRRQEAKAAREREKDRIAQELDMASDLQTSMLPSRFPAFPDRPEFDLCASMDPAKEVGGDFYDFFLVNEDLLALVTADVSGKGVPAALFMMVSKTLLRNSAETGISPSAVLLEVNSQIAQSNKNNMFVTVWLGVLELSTGRRRFRAAKGDRRPRTGCRQRLRQGCSSVR